MKTKSTIAAFLLLMFGGIASAQVTNEGKPMSWKSRNIEKVEAHKLPRVDLAKLQAEDAQNDEDKNKPWRYGHEFLVDHSLQNSGNWTTLSNGDRVWRMRYTSDGAQTMNFVFSDYFMPEGGKVYLYNDDRTDLLGAYDAQQNNEKRELGTWLVKGSDIWIEYYEPAAVTGQGKLEIFKVVHGYRSLGIAQQSPDDGLNTSGDCNYDVNCFMGDIDGLKDINKKSVALIIVSNSAFCTGALINNTTNDGTPYFLTADHCVENQNVSQWAFRFNWISTNPVCAGSTESVTNTPNYYQTVSGAELKAKNAITDFALLEITADMPDTWDLVWAGWDRSATPAQSTFGIHHPAGDIMKASRDYDAPVVDTYEGMDIWLLSYELGITEGGSSGSPLFNQDGRIVGQLWGGNGRCSGYNGLGVNLYGRLDVSWNAGTAASERLKEWLDPTNTDAITLDHYPLQSTYAVSARVSIPQINIKDCATDVKPVVKLINKGTQNLTSAQINYSLNGIADVVNWTGDLAINTAENVELPELTVVDGENNLIVNVSQPNWLADEDTSDNTASMDFINNSFPITDVLFSLMTDEYGNETTWELKNEQGDVLYEGGNYGKLDNDIQIFRLTETGCYTFTIYDAYGDGICCTHGNGHYLLKTEGGIKIQQGGSFGESESVSFRLTDDTASSEDIAFRSAIKVYPNPSTGIFNIVSENNLDYKLSNMLGQVIKTGNVNQTGIVDISANASGVYMLNVTDVSSGKTANYKLVKQ